MKIINSDIVRFYENFITNKENGESKIFPVMMAYAIKYNSRVLMSTYRAIKEQQSEIIKKYATKDENGNISIDDNGNIIIDATQKELVMREIGELLQGSVDVPLTYISIKDIERTDEEKYDGLSVADIDVLIFMIER